MFPKEEDHSGKIVQETRFSDLLKIPDQQNHGSLKLPNLPEPILSLSFQTGKIADKKELFCNKSTIKLAASDVVEVSIVSAQRLTAVDDTVKTTLQLSLQFQKNQKIQYEPGDSFAILCPNASAEVEMLIDRLGLKDVCDVPYEITSVNGKTLPPHIPFMSNLRHIFVKCVDIRSVPKKVLLRVLASYCEKAEDRNALEFLSSQEGSVHYNDVIRKCSLSILDVLNIFKSCNLPPERLLEHLPPLKPRYYSVANSPLVSNNTFNIVFNVVNIESQNVRKGLCTGWLEEISTDLLNKRQRSAENVSTQLSRLSLTNELRPVESPHISVFKRVNLFFRLPKDYKLPLIMVGPGTGVAPFVGFLQHREIEKAKSNKKDDFGETWLFYGCRHEEKDFLFRSELRKLELTGVLSRLLVCFSRDDQDSRKPRRVQDNIVAHAESISKLIDSGAVIFVCGDAKFMARDVRDAFMSVFQLCKGLSADDARAFVKQLEDEKRYITDIWT